jgi:hypothetical protein
MLKKPQENRTRHARRRPDKIRDSVEEMMALMTDENGDVAVDGPAAKPPKRKRRDTWERVMKALTPDERADAQMFLENYVDYLQHRHDYARKRRHKAQP